MADEKNTAPEDLGAPVSYLVLPAGIAVYDRSGDPVGKIAHVLADDRVDVFHGLIIKTDNGHRYAASDQVDGIYQHGVIVAEPAAELPEPSADPAAAATDVRLTDQLKRAWEWISHPR